MAWTFYNSSGEAMIQDGAMTIANNTNNRVVTATGADPASLNGESGLTFDTSNGHLTVGDGNLVIGTHGHGIDFSANTDDEGGSGSLSSELLDDYEEGTWTPGISGSSLDPEGDDQSQGYDLQVGHYTKIGRLVTISGNITMNNITGMTGGHTANIVGLPFTSKNVTSYSASVHFGNGSGLAIGDNHSIAGVILLNRVYIDCKEWDSTTGVGSALTITQLSADGHLEFSASYIT